MSALRTLALAAAAAAFFTGCGDTPSDADPADRVARRFLPFDPAWIPEADIPEKPQVTPAMVIWEVSESDPALAPTAAQRDAARDLIDDPGAERFDVAYDLFKRLRAVIQSHFGYEEREIGEAIGYYLGGI